MGEPPLPKGFKLYIVWLAFNPKEMQSQKDIITHSVDKQV